MAGAGEAAGPPLLYVSWGGTGRAATVRQAMVRAADEDRGLHYLAVLDDDTFADLDRSLAGLVAEELTWLLDAQLNLTAEQIGATDLPVSVEVRRGRVVDLVAETADGLGRTQVLIGAPVPVAGHASVEALLDRIAERTGCPVALVSPDPT